MYNLFIIYSKFYIIYLLYSINILIYFCKEARNSLEKENHFKIKNLAEFLHNVLLLVINQLNKNYDEIYVLAGNLIEQIFI